MFAQRPAGPEGDERPPDAPDTPPHAPAQEMKCFQPRGGRGVHADSGILLHYTQVLCLDITVLNQKERGIYLQNNHFNRVRFSPEKRWGKRGNKFISLGLSTCMESTWILKHQCMAFHYINSGMMASSQRKKSKSNGELYIPLQLIHPNLLEGKNRSHICG